ncbi:MAG: HAD family hydrolase [Bacilli bacterium]|nr:HAD family hydrolase [Bacilli bacterium]
MNKYLILSDLDSTLLTTKKNIPLATRIYIRKLVKKGHMFVIATGRPVQGTIRFARLLKIKNPIICDNGANIYIPNENGYEHISNHMDKETFKSLFSKIDPYLFSGFVGSDNYLFMENKKYIPWWIIHDDKEFNIKRVEGKLKNIVTEDLHISFFQIIKEGYQKTVDVLESYKDFAYGYWGEKDGLCTFVLSHKNANKGKAMQYLIERYQIDPTKTIAFGDENNDISMIKKAHYGVAIKNCSDELEKVAKAFTKSDNDHQGVKKHLQKIFRENE